MLQYIQFRPARNGGTDGVQCMTYREGQPVTAGIYDLHNTGTSPATVHRVGLPSAHGLRMTEVWLVPIRHTTLIGAGWPYPPTTSPVWAQRQPAAGAVIRPGQDLNLVFGLTRTSARDGRSAGPVIVYSASGTSYTMHEAVSLIVSGNCLAEG